MEAAAKRQGMTGAGLVTPDSVKRASERFSFDTPDEVYSAIGYGGVTVNQVFFKLLDYFRKESPTPIVARPFRSKGEHGSVIINGETGLLVSFAGCCSPVPGDDIVGFVTRGRGVVVHRKDCPNMKHADPGRVQPAEWQAPEGAGPFKASRDLRADGTGAARAGDSVAGSG